jgi:hypothetical protein
METSVKSVVVWSLYGMQMSLKTQSRGIVQADSQWHLTTECRVQSPLSSSAMFGGLSDTAAGFLPVILSFHAFRHLTTAPYPSLTAPRTV